MFSDPIDLMRVVMNGEDKGRAAHGSASQFNGHEDRRCGRSVRSSGGSGRLRGQSCRLHSWGRSDSEFGALLQTVRGNKSGESGVSRRRSCTGDVQYPRQAAG